MPPRARSEGGAIFWQPLSQRPTELSGEQLPGVSTFGDNMGDYGVKRPTAPRPVNHGATYSLAACGRRLSLGI